MPQKRSEISINLTQQSQLSNGSLVRDFAEPTHTILSAKEGPLDEVPHTFHFKPINANQYGRHLSLFLLTIIVETGALHDYLIYQQLLSVQYGALAIFVLFLLTSVLLIIDLTHTQRVQYYTSNAFEKAIDVHLIEGVYQKKCEIQRKTRQLQIYLPNLLKLEINCTYTLFMGFLSVYFAYVAGLHFYLCVQISGTVLAVIILGTVVCLLALFLALGLFVCMVCKQRSFERTKILPRIKRKKRAPEVRITCQKSTNLSCFKTMKNTNKKVQINDKQIHYFAYDKDVPANHTNMSFDKGNFTSRSNGNKINYTSILTCNQNVSEFTIGCQKIEQMQKSNFHNQQTGAENQGRNKQKQKQRQQLNCYD